MFMALRPTELAFAIGELQVYQGSRVVSWSALVFYLGSLQKNDVKREILNLYPDSIYVESTTRGRRQTLDDHLQLHHLLHHSPKLILSTVYRAGNRLELGLLLILSCQQNVVAIRGSFGIFAGQGQTPPNSVFELSAEAGFTKVPKMYLWDSFPKSH